MNLNSTTNSASNEHHQNHKLWTPSTPQNLKCENNQHHKMWTPGTPQIPNMNTTICEDNKHHKTHN